MKIFSAKYTADYYYVKKLISVISFYNTGLILPLLTTACLIQRRNISQLILSGKNPILVKEIMSFEGLWEQVQQQRYYSTWHRFAKAGIYYWSSLNLSEFLFPTERHPASSTSLLYSLYHLFIPKDQVRNGDITALQDGLPEPLLVLHKKTFCFISLPFSSKFSIVNNKFSI